MEVILDGVIQEKNITLILSPNVHLIQHIIKLENRRSP
jgi:hypothetical protein